MNSMIQVAFENADGLKIGKMIFPSGAIPQIGDRVTFLDDDGFVRQRDVVRGRHFIQSIHEPGVSVKLFVMSESEILTEASQTEYP